MHCSAVPNVQATHEGHVLHVSTPYIWWGVCRPSGNCYHLLGSFISFFFLHFLGNDELSFSDLDFTPSPHHSSLVIRCSLLVTRHSLLVTHQSIILRYYLHRSSSRRAKAGPRMNEHLGIFLFCLPSSPAPPWISPFVPPHPSLPLPSPPLPSPPLASLPSTVPLLPFLLGFILLLLRL